MEQHTPLAVTQHQRGQGEEPGCGYRRIRVQKSESTTENGFRVIINQKLISNHIQFIFII